MWWPSGRRSSNRYFLPSKGSHFQFLASPRNWGRKSHLQKIYSSFVYSCHVCKTLLAASASLKQVATYRYSFTQSKLIFWRWSECKKLTRTLGEIKGGLGRNRTAVLAMRMPCSTTKPRALKGIIANRVWSNIQTRERLLWTTKNQGYFG